jgi:hypothetical protein
MGHKISKEHQPVNRKLYSKDYQASPEAKSRGQRRRRQTQRLANAILDSGFTPEVLAQMKKVMPELSEKITRKEAMIRSCSKKAIVKGNTKAMIDLFKVADVYREKAPEDAEREFDGVEYDEL